MSERGEGGNSPAPSAPMTGPRPLLMDDVYRTIGALYLEIETQRRLITHLRERLAAHGEMEG